MDNLGRTETTIPLSKIPKGFKYVRTIFGVNEKGEVVPKSWQGSNDEGPEEDKNWQIIPQDDPL